MKETVHIKYFVRVMKYGSTLNRNKCVIHCKVFERFLTCILVMYFEMGYVVDISYKILLCVLGAKYLVMSTLCYLLFIAN